MRIAEELNKPLDYFIKDDGYDYKVESRLASVENVTEKLLGEIRKVQNYLKKNPQKDPSK